MTAVRFLPLAADGTATGTAASTVTVRLVDAGGQPLIGLRTTDGAPVTAYVSHDIAADGAEWVVDLTPQSAIATHDGAASYYDVEIRADHRREPYRIQVPDSVNTLDLIDLVGGAAVDPADITAGLLLTPDERAAMDAANAPDADNPFATIADVESGVAGVASFEGRTGTVTAAAGDYQASEITVDAAGFNGNLATTDVTVQMVAQKIDDLVVGGGGDGDVIDGGILATGLTFPVDGLHILDTNASHDLILSPGSDLTADRTLTLTTGDANRTLTLTADASVGGTNTGDQDLTGYVTKATYDAHTILAATSDNTPVAVTVAEQTLVGRITGGSIDDLSATQARTLLNVADGSTAAGAAGDAYATSHESDVTAHPASSIVNTPAGNIAATTVQAALNELDSEKAAASHFHAAGDITSGTMATARLGSGTADGTTYLRGDQTWAAVTGGSATQAFGTIVVAGQSNVVADAAPDTLTLAAGAHITITTDAGADSVTIASDAASALDELTDVTIATPAVDQILKYDGAGWINAAVSTISSSAGVDFFPDDTAIIAAGAENTYPVKTLTKYPAGGAEDVDSIVLSSNTVPYGEYLYNAALGSTSIEAGVWTFSFYVGVSSAVNVTSLSTNIMRVRPGTGTVTITGTGTSRTATASSGTPFATAAIDASATNIDASWLYTPKGIYQITARTSDTEVTIATPTGYVNESTVAYSVHKKLFNVSSGEINNVGSTYATMALIEVNSAQPAYTIEATDKLAAFFFGTSDGSRTVYFSHNGTSKYTHFHTPLATRHNDLAGLQGGSASEQYHLTAAQATVVGNTSGTNTGDQDLTGYVTKATYDANTILAANTDNTPAALTVAEQTLVGRITGGSIDDLSATQVRTLLNVADGATAAGAAGDAYATSHESDVTAHPASSIVNTPAGNIAATTVQAALNELDSEKAAASHSQAETTITFTDVATGNTSTTAHGFAPKAAAPASGALNALGIANGETEISNKTIFEGMLKVVILTRAAYTALGGGRPSTNLYIING